ncbi:MAG: YicC family protein [Fibrobacterales bacterium]
MALQSMTGFGKSETRYKDMEISLELKSVNNRYLESNLRIPRTLSPYENEFKKLIQQKLIRGSVSLSINISSETPSLIPAGYNKALVKSYLKIATDIQKAHKIPGEVTIDQILQLQDLITYSKTELNGDLLAKQVKKQLNEALKQLIEMRSAEGDNLKKDILARIDLMDSTLKEIKKLTPKRAKDTRDKLLKRVEELMGKATLDENRLIQEISIIADKIDVTEEIVRFESHIKAFKSALKSNGPHGKKLNFLLQELLREANTLGTKSNFPEMSHRTVILKEEIETIKEQVLNIL